jgi:hypothetical protein
MSDNSVFSTIIFYVCPSGTLPILTKAGLIVISPVCGLIFAIYVRESNCGL